MIVQNDLSFQIMEDGGVFEKPAIFFFFTILPQKLHTSSMNEWVTVIQVSLEIPVHPPPQRKSKVSITCRKLDYI